MSKLMLVLALCLSTCYTAFGQDRPATPPPVHPMPTPDRKPLVPDRIVIEHDVRMPCKLVPDKVAIEHNVKLMEKVSVEHHFNGLDKIAEKLDHIADCVCFWICFVATWAVAISTLLFLFWLAKPSVAPAPAQAPKSDETGGSA